MKSGEDGYHIGKCPFFVGQETARRREGGGWTEAEADGHKNSCYERARLPHSRGKWWTPESVDQTGNGLNLRVRIQQKLRETEPARKKCPKLSESIAQASSLNMPRHHLQMTAMSPSRRRTPKPPLCAPHTHWPPPPWSPCPIPAWREVVQRLRNLQNWELFSYKSVWASLKRTVYIIESD